MILTGKEIEKQFYANKIKLSEFDEKLVGTNSYDICLGNTFIQYTSDVLDPKIENPYKVIALQKDGLFLPKGSFILAESSISIGSDYYVPLIHGRSSSARLGLFSHITADLFDIGFYGKATLQIYNILPIKIYPGIPIAQVSFWVPKGDIQLYSGKYQGADGPVPSKIHQSLDNL